MSKETLEALEGLSTNLEQKHEEMHRKYEEREASLNEKLENLAKESAEGRAALEETIRGLEESALTLNLDDKDVERFSVGALVRGLQSGNPEKDCPYEWDIHKELLNAESNKTSVVRRMGEAGVEDLRAMLSTSDVSGGLLIPEEVSNTFYGNYRAQTVRGRLGITEVTPKGIPWRANKKTANTTAYRRGEAQAVNESAIAFGQLNLTPKSVAARAVVSQENIMWPEPSVDSMLERDLMESLDLKKDYDLIAGPGGSNTPIGVLNSTGVVDHNSGSGSGHAPTYEIVGIDMIGLLEDANAYIDDGSLAYLGVPGHARMLRKERIGGSTSSDGQYIIPSWAMPTSTDFFPHKFISTTALQGQGLGADSGASPLLFGRWSDCIHATFGGLLVKKSDTATDGTYNALTQGMFHIVVTGWDDGGVIRPASIVYDSTMDHA